jgi:pyruvate dehydrogenase E2 component (dihydrolipoamide acetyltransferase)
MKKHVKKTCAIPAPGEVRAAGFPDFGKWGEIERKPMDSIRRKIAQRMSMSWNTIPHVVHYDKADITGLERLIKEQSVPDNKLSITPFLVKIAASALKAFPGFNASGDFQNNEIIYRKYCNIGVAVDTDRGLFVPVIKDADKKNIFTIAEEIRAAVVRAREKKIAPEEMSGGCFTVTNLGMIGGTAFAPVINWPESAILGAARSSVEPVYKNNKFIPRTVLTLSVSYDHRLIDGADGARFLRWAARALENPVLLELEG